MTRPATNTTPQGQEPIEDPNDDGTALPTQDGDDDLVDDQPPDDQPPAAVAAPAAESMVDDPEFGKLTPREKALIQKARSQEKKKLYEELNSLKTRLKDLERVASAPSRSVASGDNGNSNRGSTRRRQQPEDDEIAEIRNEISQLTAAIRQRDDEQAARERRSELRQYRTDRIAELRAAGTNFIEPLVVHGESEEAIDNSIEVAVAEAAHQEQLMIDRYGIDTSRTGRPTTARAAATRTVVVRNRPRRPDDAPAPIAASVSGTSPDEISAEQIAELTSIEAVRNGTYAQNREKLFKALKNNRIVSR